MVSRAFPGQVEPPAPGYPDPWQRLVRRLAGLRLWTRGEEERLVRMHRLVQDVTAARAAAGVLGSCQEALTQHAFVRAEQLHSTWGQLDTQWEVPPLRDLALLSMSQESRYGVLLAHLLYQPLAQLGQFAVLETLLQRAATLGQRWIKQAPDHADHACDLSISVSRLGDLYRVLGHAQRASSISSKPWR